MTRREPTYMMLGMDAPPQVEINAFTHRGRIRKDNEDTMTVASRYAIKRLVFETFAGGEPDVAVTLAEINAELYQSMVAAPSLRGMGTTVAGLLLVAGRAIWFNIGDSRVYRCHGGKLEQLS